MTNKGRKQIGCWVGVLSTIKAYKLTDYGFEGIYTFERTQTEDGYLVDGATFETNGGAKHAVQLVEDLIVTPLRLRGECFQVPSGQSNFAPPDTFIAKAQEACRPATQACKSNDVSVW